MASLLYTDLCPWNLGHGQSAVVDRHGRPQGFDLGAAPVWVGRRTADFGPAVVSSPADSDPKAFLRHAKCFHEGQAHFAHQFHNPVPLLDLSGITSYYPYRVAHQYKALQETPPPLKTDMFRVRFTRSNYNYAEEIRVVQRKWTEYQPESILIPRLLKGQEKAQHASLFYIGHHQIPGQSPAKSPGCDQQAQSSNTN
ncbi:hypothetical protein NL676_034355 [Syzygium grande]|nr:hypothetical protein NL676_034355 [Syzygium grande]